MRYPVVRGGCAVAPDQLDVVVFEVGGQLYALPAPSVLELVRAVAIVPLPRAPAIVEGIINLRGKLVPVLDIRSRFRLQPRPLHPNDHLLIATAGPHVVAIRADRAVNLIHLDHDEIEEARGLVPGVNYVSWVAKLPNNLVLIHDLGTFLSRSESSELQGALDELSRAGAQGEGSKP
jgi:purine-binding chemotaxis protein CheW